MLPLLTSARNRATKLRSASRSASVLSEAKARSSGRPDETKPASWRVQTLKALALKTRRLKKLTPWLSLVLVFAKASTFNGTKACARNRLRAALAESASMVPLRVCPSALSASKANAGMAVCLVARHTHQLFAGGDAKGDQAFAVLAHEHHAFGQSGCANVCLGSPVVNERTQRVIGF